MQAVPNGIITEILEWLFGGLLFKTFISAEDAAWLALEDWLDEWEDHEHPDINDERIRNVCDFYYEYRAEYDLDEMGDILRDDGYCSEP